MTDTLTAEQAIERLNIKAMTLYSYVSRGLIRTLPDPSEARRRLYVAEDIERLLKRRESRRNGAAYPSEVAPVSIPSLFGAIGMDALKLAASQTFERAIMILWEQGATPINDLFGQTLTPIPSESVGLPPLSALMTALAAESAYDVRAYDVSAGGLALTGARILRLMTDVLSGGAAGGRMAERLATAWRGQASVFDAALILLADEDRPSSAMGVGLTRSEGATPYAAVLNGLTTLMGRVGSEQSAAAGLLREVGVPERAYAVVGQRVRHGGGMPGFLSAPVGNLSGERRAGALLALARMAYPDGAVLVDAVIEAARYAAANVKPGMGFALAALEVAGRLPEGAGLGLLALGRAAAWLQP